MSSTALWLQNNTKRCFLELKVGNGYSQWLRICGAAQKTVFAYGRGHRGMGILCGFPDSARRVQIHRQNPSIWTRGIPLSCYVIPKFVTTFSGHRARARDCCLLSCQAAVLAATAVSCLGCYLFPGTHQPALLEKGKQGLLGGVLVWSNIASLGKVAQQRVLPASSLSCLCKSPKACLEQSHVFIWGQS